jgi:predicted transposase YbfD/YdcC
MSRRGRGGGWVSDEIFSQHTEVNTRHGRTETITCQLLLVNNTWLDKKYQWPGLKSIIKVTSDVVEKSTEKEPLETCWYISSLSLNSERALNSVRSHWQVESMHWVLDMTFREDESRIRKSQAPLAFNVMRKIAMALLKQDKTKRASMVAKKKMAGLDDEYRSTLLESGIKMR